MPYVHLANGDVKHFDAEEFVKAFGDGAQTHYRENGVEHHVIGVYPDEVEYDQSVEAENQQLADDRAEFEAWREKRDAKAAKNAEKNEVEE